MSWLAVSERSDTTQQASAGFDVCWISEPDSINLQACLPTATVRTQLWLLRRVALPRLTGALFWPRARMNPHRHARHWRNSAGLTGVPFTLTCAAVAMAHLRPRT